MNNLKVENWITSELGQNIWEHKYRYNNESFEQWINRISNNNEDVKKLILEKKFLFGGRILANRGLDKLGKKVTYSNCYVLPQIEDNLENIFDTAKYLARTFSYSGGVGIDISKLRPNGMPVHNAAEKTTGSTSFMDLYSKVTEVIGAKGRRGALMISIICTHPDLLNFINIKNDLDKVTKANISIRILDAFMEAVENNDIWELYFKDEYNNVLSEKHNARDLFKLMCKNNWDMAEPGMLFWDRISNWNLLSEDDEFEYAGTNPCAEEPLPAGGSCLLGSLNLSEFVKNEFTDKSYFDINEFKSAVAISVNALNEVLMEGLPLHPLQIQRDTVNNWRQIGLGIFGLADMLIKLGITYGSKESLILCNDIGFAMIDKSLETSALISKEQGTYPKYKKDAILKSEFLHKNTSGTTLKLIEEYGLAHSQLLTIAPTGSLSTMLGVSGGIEPVYNISYTRKTESLHDGEVLYKVYTPIAEKYMNLYNIKNEEDLPKFFITAMTLNYKERIAMQSIWQEHIDASISSTVNVPNEFTVENVEELYMEAWRKGLKGVTIYRDGCARGGVLINNDKDKEQPSNDYLNPNLLRGEWKQKAEDTIYHEHKLSVGCGKLKLFIGWSDKEQTIQDLYVIRSGRGGCERTLQALTITMSGMLRLGGNIFNIEKAFEGVGGCNSFANKRAKGELLSKGDSCGTAILNCIKDFLNEKNINKKEEVHIEGAINDSKTTNEEYKEFIEKHGQLEFIKTFNRCPICFNDIQYSGGCLTCGSCGYSKCD